MDVHDRLEPLGILVGAALVLVALVTVLEAPWATNGNTLVTLVQLVGVVATVAVGVGLARLSAAD